MRYYVYCPSHLTIHPKDEDGSVWCTTDNHVGLGAHDADSPQQASSEARRRGFKFYHGDVVNLRDSARSQRVEARSLRLEEI